MAASKNKSKRKKGKIVLAKEYAKQSLETLKPESINDLINKVKAKTRRRLEWHVAKSLYQEFRSRFGASEKPSAPPRKRRRGRAKPSPAPVRTNGDLFLVVTKDQGFRLEVLRYLSKPQAERKATELIEAGRKVRVLTAHEAKVSVQANINPS